MSIQRDGSHKGGILNARDVMVFLVFMTRFIQTVLRMAMAPLLVYVCEDLGCGRSSQGWLLSAYAMGYCTTQIIGGRIADRAGGKDMVTLSLAAAGLSLAATPVAASVFGLVGVAAMQAVMGMATGPLFPATMQLLGKWLPSSERPRASIALDTGITVGSLVAVPLSGLTAVHVGWHMVLVGYGMAAVAFSVAWATLASESPDQCNYCSEAERTFLAQTLPARPKQGSDVASRGFIEGFIHVRFWAIYAAHFAFNYGVYFITNWSAMYYLETFKMRPEDAGVHLTLPHGVNFIMNVFMGPWLNKALRNAGFSDLSCRRTFTGLGFAVMSLGFVAVPAFAGNIVATTAAFTLATSFAALHPSGFKANYMDVTTTQSGVVSGIGNTIGSVASSIGPLAVTRMRLQSEGSWDSAFISTALLCLLAALVFCTLSSTVPIEADTAKEPNKKPQNKVD